MKAQKKGLLCLVLLLSLLTACVPEDGASLPPVETDFISRVMEQEQNPRFGGKKTLSAAGLAQEICWAMNRPESISEIYRSLPSNIRESVDEETFRLYVAALRPANGEPIVSFHEVKPEEKESYVSRVLEQKPAWESTARRSRYFLLDYRPEGGSRRSEDELAQVLLAVQMQDESAGIMEKWARSVIQLHEYADLYFDALSPKRLSAGEPMALLNLISQSEPLLPEEDWQDYTRLKAGRIARYYEERVTTLPSASVCRYLLPGCALYVQDYRYGYGLSGKRSVSFTEKDGRFEAQESIPDEMHADDCIMIYGQPLFPGSSLKSEYDSTDLHPLAGPVLDMKETSRGDDEHPSTWKVSYYGFSIELEGVADENCRTWSGRVFALEMDSRVAGFGPGIRPGAPLYSLYERFPFFRENGQILSMRGEPFRSARLDYDESQGKITRLYFRSED